MTLYSHNGATPAPLPFRITLPDGRARTDPTSFTEAEIADAGYVPALARPEHHEETQHTPEWDGVAWLVRDKSDAEIEADLDAAAPMTITMRQARLALLVAGLLDGVNAALNALPSPQKEAALIEWEYTATVRRDSPLITSLAPALGMDAASIRSLFSMGETL